MIQESLKTHKKERLRRFIEERCEQVVLAFFEEANGGAKRNDHTSFVEVTEQIAVKYFIIGGAAELLDEKMGKLAESQDFSYSIVRHPGKSSTCTAPARLFMKEQAEKAVASKYNF